MRMAEGGTLIAATIAVGLMAGVFGLYAVAIMPGLRGTDDRTFVGAFQAIDRAILNPVFLSVFVGALLLTGLAVALQLGSGRWDVSAWVVAAFVLYLIAFIVTVRINVPLNDGIKAAGVLDGSAELARVRDEFDEGRWAAWNLVRTAATTAGFGCLLWALVQLGRHWGTTGG